MANEKRLISVEEWDTFFNEHIYNRCFRNEYEQGYTDALDRVDDWMDTHPAVDAVPVDDILLHHILIDENGIPEVKLQFGDRTLVLRREGDPVDVVEVVHGRWEWLGPNRLTKGCMCGTCSACKVRSKYIVNTSICPNCGAMMDGGKR